MLAACLRLLSIQCFLLFYLLFTIFLPFAYPLSFNITNFSDANAIAYQGDGTATNGSIELNTPNSYRTGRAFSAQPLRLWDNTTRVLTDFTTRFSFIIDILNNTIYSDGFAFYMAPVGYQIPPNSAGGQLGLFNSTTNQGVPGNRVFTVEFDTFINEYDPPMRHVGFNNNSIRSFAYTWFDLGRNTGKLGHAMITYNGTSKILSVSWSFNGSSSHFFPNSTLSYQVDLMRILPEWVDVGFSAATGVYPERHVIQWWEFSSTLNVTEVTRNGSERNSRRNRVLIIVVIICCSFALVVTGFFWYITKKRRNRVGGTTVVFDLNRETIPRRFYYQELASATNGFADDRKLGSGGSGQVFKGLLNDLGRVVAVKRISAHYENSERTFINEVKIISRLIHRNLVQFIGWCHEQNEFLLVFEYMLNGSLDNHLFGNRRTIPWNTRYKIAIGVATALHYLHEDAEQSVLHRDIKSANVLLDNDFNTKLGDFGLAKLVDPRLRTQRTGVVGTYGYLAPEYLNGGRATKEIDMYSFGVVALEISCGRRTYQEGDYHIPLVNWVWSLYVEGNVLIAADERLNGEFNVEEMTCLLTLGLWCTHPNDKERPKAAHVIKVLQLESPLPGLPHDMHDSASSRPNPNRQAAYSVPSEPITTSLVNVGR
ncbi:hypothetical protein L6164_024396 [Bauhinia variegata]|uniref:Uncharacterized protein n=1 Tax=Bauhinia variegata TaxID=167791 RepID=A0ACB9LZQ8_BAUVA|nr:hypothetical protein L6164_024396 [Bauhinia variegata]